MSNFSLKHFQATGEKLLQNPEGFERFLQEKVDIDAEELYVPTLFERTEKAIEDALQLYVYKRTKNSSFE